MTNKQQKTKVDELRDALQKKAGKEQPEDVEVKEESAEEIEAHIEDKLLRVMAEFENFKKRMQREREEQFKYSNEKLLKELLPAMDDLDRVLEHVSPGSSEETKAIADGVELVRKSLMMVFEKFGLTEVPAIGEAFDPQHHEAIAMVESDAHEPGKVMAVHRKGYKLFERLIRPAMVTVAKNSVNRES